MAGTDRDWMRDAACRHRPDLDWFDMGCDLQAVLEVCTTCPVDDHCLQYAIDNDCTEGVWSAQFGYRLHQLVREGRRG